RVQQAVPLHPSLPRSADRGLDSVSSWGPYALVLYLLAASRWGSQLVPGPPYVADIVLAGLIAERLFAIGVARERGRGVDAGLAFTTSALLAWTGLVFVAGQPTVTAV